MSSRREIRFGLLAIVLLALGLRLWMPGPTILTYDEMSWQLRSKDFRIALATGDFENAIAAPRGVPATRPGVPTMWMGAVAIQTLGPPFEHRDDAQRRRGQQLMAMWCSLWLLPLMLATRRLFGGRVALIAGGLLAVEPLLVGHSRLLHTDAALTVTAATAALALLAAFEALRSELQATDRTACWRSPSTHWSVLAGVAGAMAVLTKLSALPLLVPFAVVAVGVHVALGWRARWIDGHGSWLEAPLQAASVVLTAALTAVIACLAVWPALWVDPIEAVTVSFEAANLASVATPRLFLGQVLERGDWRFYPVVAYFVTSPWLLIGTVAAVIAVIVRRASGRPRLMSRRIALGLAAYTLPYLVIISLSEKQYGRYLLPLLPIGVIAVAVIAASALERFRVHRFLPVGTWAALGVAALWTLSLTPYQISHVNPLVGGQQVAVRNIPLGWGEGQERFQLGDEPCDSAWMQGKFWLFFIHCPIVDDSWLDGDIDPPGYIARYVRAVQVAEHDPRLDAYLRDHAELIYHAEIGGVTYVEVWRSIPTA